MRFRCATILLIAVGFSGCKINKTINGEREGLWVEKSAIGDVRYKSKGRFENGFEKKTWRFYENGKLVQKRIYKDSLCHIIHFKNCKKTEEGFAKIRVTESEIRWFYTGEWYDYDPTGKCIAIRKYDEGEMVWEKELN